MLHGQEGSAHQLSDLQLQILTGFEEGQGRVVGALEVVLIQFSNPLLTTGMLVILLSRLLTVGVPIALLGERFRLPEGAWSVMTWGGLRGGISMALPGAARNIVVCLTYLVVVFSILIQSMSIGKLVKRVIPCAATKDAG